MGLRPESLRHGNALGQSAAIVPVTLFHKLGDFVPYVGVPRNPSDVSQVR
jgi:hypothetical protein